jgi:hypothetical protein
MSRSTRSETSESTFNVAGKMSNPRQKRPSLWAYPMRPRRHPFLIFFRLRPFPRRMTLFGHQASRMRRLPNPEYQPLLPKITAEKLVPPGKKCTLVAKLLELCSETP